jgi:hypothetical protein
MVIVDGSQIIRSFDVATADVLATLETANPGTVHAMRFSRDDQWLAITRWNGSLQLWDLRKLRRRLTEPGLAWDQ